MSAVFCEKSRFISPFSFEEIEKAINNARTYADILAEDSAILTVLRGAFRNNTKNYVCLLIADDATRAASRIASQAHTKLTKFICDFKSPSGFLMDQEELMLGLNLTREWLDTSTRRQDFGELKGIILGAIDNIVG